MKEKKPFYKKWWVWLIVVLVIIGFATSGENDDVAKETEKVSTSVGSDAPEEKELSSGDQEACDIYAEVARFVERGESTNQVYEIIDDAFYAADSNELMDLLDELLYQIEEDGSIEDAASEVSEWCSL